MVGTVQLVVKQWPRAAAVGAFRQRGQGTGTAVQLVINAWQSRSRQRAVADARVPGKTRCTFHDPELAAERAEGRRRGRESRSRPVATLPPDTPDATLASVQNVAAFLAVTLNQVRTGQLAVGVGNCLFVGAGVLLKAIEGGELEQRLAVLEAGQAQPQRRRIA